MSSLLIMFDRLLGIVLIGLCGMLLSSCEENRPTATLKVVFTFDGCTTDYTTRIVQTNGEPVTTAAQLNGVNGEITSTIGCNIEELEYAFNADPLAAKVEIDLDSVGLGEGEITAFIPLDNRTPPPQPFIINYPNFRSVSAEVVFPNAAVKPLRGFVPAKR
ncbi:MAG: hypothetical protein KME17_15330 [Cyanosarcina radialis HA8281-LM2]|jgi:hypothetical protein|nr:hypothetical protein [Cyanosarcina radialis HA8281-LM2]